MPQQYTVTKEFTHGESMQSGRWIMIFFALMEAVAVLIAIIESASASHQIGANAHAMVGHKTVPATDHTYTCKTRMLAVASWCIVFNVIALVSLLGVSSYYSLGKRLQYYGRMQVWPIKASRYWLKLSVIVLGAVGIVASSMGVATAAVGVWLNDEVNYPNALDRLAAGDALKAAAALSGLTLALKLAEAVLGHAWAISLDNCHRKEQAA